jgi:hypothetical protein
MEYQDLEHLDSTWSATRWWGPWRGLIPWSCHGAHPTPMMRYHWSPCP